MKRRDVLKSALAGAAALAAPAIVRAENQKTITFVPHADLASLDPVWTTADITRNFALAVYDTLYGYDAKFSAQPQITMQQRQMLVYGIYKLVVNVEWNIGCRECLFKTRRKVTLVFIKYVTFDARKVRCRQGIALSLECLVHAGKCRFAHRAVSAAHKALVVAVC